MKITLLFFLILLFGCASKPQPLDMESVPASGPIPESEEPVTKYESVAQALQALLQKPGVNVRFERGWTIVQDKTNPNELVLWSFTPVSHPAHPAVAKRTIFEKDGKVWVTLHVQCEASKSACDDFVRDFNQLNKQVKEHFN